MKKKNKKKREIKKETKRERESKHKELMQHMGNQIKKTQTNREQEIHIK